MRPLDGNEIDQVGGGFLPLLGVLFGIGVAIGYLAGPQGIEPVGEPPLPALGT